MNNTTTLPALYEGSDPQSPSTVIILMASLQILINLFILASNAMVLSAVFMYPDLRRVQHNYVIINMAVTDFLLGAVVLPWSILFRLHGRWVFSEFVCRFYQGFMSFVCHESIFSAFILSVDKYIFIKYPLHYYNMITSKRLLIAISVSWLVAFLDNCLPTFAGWNADPTPEEFNVFPLCFLYSEQWVIFSFIPALGPLLVIMYLNFYVLKVLRNQNRSIHPPTVNPQSRAQPPANDEQTVATVETSRLSVPNQGIQIPKGEIKVIKSMVLIGVFFLILWLPVHLVAVSSAICYCVDPIFIEITHWLGFSNSAINPLLYAYKQDFRTAYGKILKLKGFSGN